ncbi:B12-binding domain-containing radical SAM protein [Alkaliphilus peptidifermentans]|uniref:Radical SAM superfamily enzyme YgiQ, UPF0313 family n=1 Tax=Alkaliphilus peptidifermentans DSM 18978 TaxID=1120976 RepID=A0A1G5K685_9FIRM|nr:radical SAM protein [Alkaliphilus peptidifermentans]SCY96106.1 Radical SAM superfamily enzyme YgiQ, UPF0313 family [Alkaliphilus peptidifermentans DSM 18978]
MKKAKVLLLAVYNSEMNEVIEEIGIASIAAYLRENGFEVMLMGANEARINYDKILSYKPDIVGLPTYTVSREAVYSVCSKLRSLLPQLHICLGGLFPTYYHRDILKDNSDIDSIARGEGETVLLSLAESISNGEDLSSVKGLTYRKKNKIIENEKQDIIWDLDQIPFPHKDIVIDNKLKHVLISTSRGCTSNCSFCVSKNYWGKWRGRSTGSIVREIKSVVESYNITSFDFVDSSFEDPDPDCKRMTDIAMEIINEGLVISYYAQIRADFWKKATPQMMELLKKSGLCGVFLGIETANEADRKIYNKTATINDNYKAIELFNKYNIVVSIGFINFNPYSSFESLYSNIKFLDRYNYARFFDKLESRYIIYNNQTKLYERLVRDNLIKLQDGCFCFEYKFVDERIEKLSNFLTNYFEKMRLDGKNYYGKLNNFNYMHLSLIQQFLRILTTLDHKRGYEVVKDHQLKVMNILSSLNKVNCDWFYSLLYLAEYDWNEGVALEVIDKSLNKSFMNNIFSDLNEAKHKLYEDLLLIEPKFINYL